MGMSFIMTRTAAIRYELAQVAHDAASAVQEAEEAAAAAYWARREAEHAAFDALSPEEQQRAVDEAYGLYDTIYDY